MDETIEIEHSGTDQWRVTVNGPIQTQHRVRLTRPELERLGQGKSAEKLIEQSFRFLLEREPNNSILSAFDLSLISRYFPEYEKDIRNRLGNSP